MTHRKKLIEVALPLDVVNDASSYDKMPGIGPHPKGMHHWWARLPLPAARTILFASLVDDPSADPRYADQPAAVQDQERQRLFDVIRTLMRKKIHQHSEVFKRAAAEIARCCDGRIPTLFDPFCGSGSIPLEAQRLGLPTRVSDLNPVAVLITKAAIEIIPKYANRPPVNPVVEKSIIKSVEWEGGRGVADDVRYYARWMLEQASSQLGNLYPKIKLPKDYGSREANVIAWLWARTVKCPNPACGAMLPLVRSFSLANRKGQQAWVKPLVDRTSCPPRISFTVRTNQGTPAKGTVTRSGARCIACRGPISLDYISTEGRASRIYPQLMAIVAEGNRGRVYLPPSIEHESIAGNAALEDAPETSLPEKALGFRVQRYGMTRHRDLFTPRQLTALTSFSNLVQEARKKSSPTPEQLVTPQHMQTQFALFSVSQWTDV